MAHLKNENILKEEILNDARGKAVRIIKKAGQNAEKVRKEAGEKADVETARILEAAQRRADIERNKILAGTDIEIKKNRLAGMDAFLEEIADEAIKQLESLKGKQAAEILCRSLEKGLAQLGEQQVTVAIAPGADEETVKKILKEQKISAEIENLQELALPEIIITARNGALRFESVFRKMYKANKDTFLRAVYSVVFGGKHG